MDQKELDKILENHKLWLESNKKEGKRARLRFENLDGINLQNKNLQEIDFEGACLNRSFLSDSNLNRANLRKSFLNDAFIRKATFIESSLEGASLKGATAPEVKLNKANLKYANLQRIKLQNAEFYETNLEGANLGEADLQGATLRYTNLKDAKLDGTNLKYVKIDTESKKHISKKIQREYTNIWFPAEKNILARSIEFLPEYKQAGINILTYFGEVLRKKFPDTEATIRIQQEGLKVTLIIDYPEGDQEIIEKTLKDYGDLVTGKITPDEFTSDQILALDLKNQLAMANTQIEMQKNLTKFIEGQIEKKDIQLDKLLSKLGELFQTTKFQSQVTISPIISVAPKITSHIGVDISPIQGTLDELFVQLPTGSEEAKSVEELQQSFEQIDKTSSPDEVAKSSAMSKFRRFLENVGKAETTAGKISKTTKDGIDIARKLAGHYNDIAQWCGLPVVPNPFVKK